MSTKKQYTTKDFIKYVIIGKMYNSNKKFRNEYSNFFHANSVNLWRGRLYGIKPDGKKVLLKTVYN